MKRLILTLLFCATVYGQNIKPIKDTKAYTLNFQNDTAVTIGDRKSATFKPQLHSEFWGGENNFTLEMLGLTGVPTLENDKVKISTTERELEWYKSDDKSLKWIIRLKSKPPDNTYTMRLGGGWEQFNFYYQPPLQNAEPYDHPGEEEWIHGYEADGYEAWRPRKVDGSYAVYHKTKRDHIQGQTNYRVGKVCHIYVPKVIDALGKTGWCTLRIENGVYKSSPPPDCTYPIIINDTFGYQSNGGTNGGCEAAVFSTATTVAAGTADTISAYVNGYNAVSWKGLIYTIDGGDSSPATMVATGAAQGPVPAEGSPAWQNSSCSSENLSATTEYYLGLVESGADVLLRYDAGSEDAWVDCSVTYANPENNPADGYTVSPRTFSVHCDYTSAAAGAAQVISVIVQ
jgi:hypothetical protein